MSVKLLTEHHLEFQSLKGGCSGSSESTHVKMPGLDIPCHDKEFSNHARSLSDKLLHQF